MKELPKEKEEALLMELKKWLELLKLLWWALEAGYIDHDELEKLQHKISKRMHYILADLGVRN